LRLDKEAYDDRKDRYVNRVKSVLDYAREEHVCRSRILLSYFGEVATGDCGHCDRCLHHQESSLGTDEFERIQQGLTAALSKGPLRLQELVRQLNYKEQKVLKALRFMMDNGLLEQGADLRYCLPAK